MRVDSLNLPQAAHSHSKVHGSGKALPGTSADKAKETANSQSTIPENLAASGTTETEKTAKTAPKGLENAISRLEAKQNSNQGIEQALEMLTRNLSRYELTPPPTDSDSSTPPPDETTASSTEASASGETTPASDSGTGNPPSATT
jgi:hypothetical protein